MARFRFTLGRILGTVFFAALGAATLTSPLTPRTHPIPVEIPLTLSVATPREEVKPLLPVQLSGEDRGRYQSIFRAQRSGQWDAADAEIAKIENPVLMGHVLAARYLNKEYQASADELTDWLLRFTDYPQVAQIAVLARSKGAANLPAVPVRTRVGGYGDDNGLAGIPLGMEHIDEAALTDRAAWNAIAGLIRVGSLDEAQAQADTAAFSEYERDLIAWELARNYFRRNNDAKAYALANAASARSGNLAPRIHWTAGLSAWRSGQFAESLRHFETLAGREEILNPWEESAAHYWAHRAARTLGNDETTQTHLQAAAAAPRTFYGILARRQLGQPLDLDIAGNHLNESDITELLESNAVLRALALSETGNLDAAESELRTHFVSSSKERRAKLLALANQLNLPALEMSLARTLSRATGRHYDFASYPLPEWKPQAGFALDPALVFAFARQESGFRVSATGQGGALGLMQLMPQTADIMKRQNGMAVGELPAPSSPDHPLKEPSVNLTLGESYLRHLLGLPAVENNLLFLMAAYNAGPGTLIQWKESIRHDNDPLLFIESIPRPITRSYVQQVMTNYWVYAELEGRPSGSVSSLALGRWPDYATATAMLVP